jgi:hypothetical protein
MLWAAAKKQNDERQGGGHSSFAVFAPEYPGGKDGQILELNAVRDNARPRGVRLFESRFEHGYNWISPDLEHEEAKKKGSSFFASSCFCFVKRLCNSGNSWRVLAARSLRVRFCVIELLGGAGMAKAMPALCFSKGK